MDVLVTVEINNAPEDLNERSGFLVARCENAELWYYGLYDDYTRALTAAKEIGNGVILNLNP